MRKRLLRAAIHTPTSPCGKSLFMNSIPLKIKFYLAAAEKTAFFSARSKAIFAGFWLGVLSRREIQSVDRIFFAQSSEYQNENYNRSGFFDWERRAFMKFFQTCQTILVAAIGGGREVVTLHDLGFDVDGFECNEQLLDFAEKLFQKDEIKGEFRLAPNDEVWNFAKVYDGAIIGWSAYMLIQTRARRIDFLKKMRAQIKKDAPLLISFFARASDENFKQSYRIANFFRTILRRKKIELGDNLKPPFFAHWFCESEINAEFAEAGFRLVYYSADEYGHAVGIRI